MPCDAALPRSAHHHCCPLELTPVVSISAKAAKVEGKRKPRRAPLLLRSTFLAELLLSLRAHPLIKSNLQNTATTRQRALLGVAGIRVQK
jgi:hypothetical protein